MIPKGGGMEQVICILIEEFCSRNEEGGMEDVKWMMDDGMDSA
jgi:hypothetical protein